MLRAVRGGASDADPDAALTELYATHYASLVKLAALLLDDPAAGEEVAQDAYVRVHGAWGRLRDADAGLAYLRRTVVNLARSRLRRRRVAEAVTPEHAHPEDSAESGALAVLEREAVVDALRQLPSRQRETLVLRYWAGLSEAEIASALGVSRGAVKSHASRGMSALRVALDPGASVVDRGPPAAQPSAAQPPTQPTATEPEPPDQPTRQIRPRPRRTP